MTFDLEAAAREAAGEPFRFEWPSGSGEMYEISPDFDPRIGEPLARDAIPQAVEILLGEKQWARIQASDAVFGFMTIQTLFTTWAEHIGFTSPGESSASTESSETTGTE